MVLTFLVVLQTQLVSSVFAEVTFLNKWALPGGSPRDVAVSDAGQVYVLDSGHNHIQRFDAEGNYETKWGSEGSGDGHFKDPFSVAVSGMGQVYVADSGNRRIQRFDADGNYQLQWGSYGSGDGEFGWNAPVGIALSGTGQVYAVDGSSNRIQRFDADGNYQLQWGSHGSGDGQFRNPTRIAISDTGKVYVVVFVTIMARIRHWANKMRVGPAALPT